MNEETTRDETWAVVGAYVRAKTADLGGTRRRTEEIEGLETFDLEREGMFGVVVEGPSIDAVHDVIEGRLTRLEGVLGVFPVSLEIDDPSVPTGAVKGTPGGVS